MNDFPQRSPFIEPVAVEAWDAWFRWRQHAELRDVSIEDTWRRVAGALASVEAEGARRVWLSRFLKVFVNWQLLPDERLLAAAGTGRVSWSGEALHAVVNAAAFVEAGPHASRRIDLAAVTQCAEVAVRALDNAALLAGTPSPNLRIGLIGVADALALLGAGYDSDAGRAQAAALAGALAEGCFRASTELAIERGATTGGPDSAIARAQRWGMPPEWLRSARRRGLRHRQLTAMTSQPRVALLANDVADALDPLLGEHHPHVIASQNGQQTIYSSGYALSVLEAAGKVDTPPPATLVDLPWTAQLAMRAAVQPWMDAAVAYPLLLERPPDATLAADVLRQAAKHGLDAPSWRIPAASVVRTAAAAQMTAAAH